MEQKIGRILPNTYLVESASSVEKDGITTSILTSKRNAGLKNKIRLSFKLTKSILSFYHEGWGIDGPSLPNGFPAGQTTL